MADGYRVGLRIAVYKGEPELMVVTEESTFTDVSFAKMTKISSEYYELIAKLEKEKK